MRKTWFTAGIVMLFGCSELPTEVDPIPAMGPQMTESEPLSSLAEAEALAAELTAAGITGTTLAFLGSSEFHAESYVETETIARTFPFFPHISHEVSVNYLAKGVERNFTETAVPLLGIAFPAYTSRIEIPIDCYTAYSETTIWARSNHRATYNIPYALPMNPWDIDFLSVNLGAPPSEDYDSCVIREPPPPPGGGGEGDDEEAWCLYCLEIHWYYGDVFLGRTFECEQVDVSMCDSNIN